MDIPAGTAGGGFDVSVETDLVKALRALWNATPFLTSAVPGGLTTDLAADDPSRGLPYAILQVQLERQQRPLTHGHAFLDFRRVIVDLYGNGKEALGQIVSTVHATFDWPVRLALAGHAWTRNGVEDREQPTGTKRHGNQIRLARLIWVVAQLRASN